MLRIETLAGPALTIQDVQIYLLSQLVQLRFPFVNGGLIWNRPLAVMLRNPDGQEKIVPIADMTRTAMFTLVGLCITGIIIMMFRRRMYLLKPSAKK